MKSQIILTQIDMLKKEHIQAVMEKKFQKANQIKKKIEQRVREYNIAKGEEDLQRAIENGTVERFNRLVAATQILNSATHNIIDEISELLKNNGLHTEGIVAENKQYSKAADRYFNEFKKLVDSDENEMNMFHDIEYFENWFRIWTKLKERPREQRLRGCLKAARKADGLSAMCRKCKMHADPYSIMCKACSKAFIEGFQKGAKWLDNKLNPKEEKQEENE